MAMQNVECRDEELVRVLLLVSGQVSRMRPHQMQQTVWRVRGAQSTIKLQHISNKCAHLNMTWNATASGQSE